MPICPYCRQYSHSPARCTACNVVLDEELPRIETLEGLLHRINDRLAARDYRSAMEACLEAGEFLDTELVESMHPRVAKARNQLAEAIGKLHKVGIKPKRIVASRALPAEAQAPAVLSLLAFFATAAGAAVLGVGMIVAVVEEDGPIIGALMATFGVVLAVIGFCMRQWAWWAWKTWVWLNGLSCVGLLGWGSYKLFSEPEGVVEAGAWLTASVATGFIAAYCGLHLDGLRHLSSKHASPAD